MICLNSVIEFIGASSIGGDVFYIVAAGWIDAEFIGQCRGDTEGVGGGIVAP